MLELAEEKVWGSRENSEESRWRDARKDGESLDTDEHWRLLGKMSPGLGGNHRTQWL